VATPLVPNLDINLIRKASQGRLAHGHALNFGPGASALQEPGGTREHEHEEKGTAA
jgi:hypothetical protein